MATVGFALITLCVAFLEANAAPEANKNAGKSGYLTNDGKLTAAFGLKDTQGGFAGFTGNDYVVQPDGSWTITSVFNRRKFKPHASGKLTAKQLKTLADSLKANKVAKLPAASRSSTQANPKIITVTFGKHQSVCTLPPDLDMLPKGADGDVARRVLAVRKIVVTLLAKKPAKPD